MPEIAGIVGLLQWGIIKQACDDVKCQCSLKGLRALYALWKAGTAVTWVGAQHKDLFCHVEFTFQIVPL